MFTQWIRWQNWDNNAEDNKTDAIKDKKASARAMMRESISWDLIAIYWKSINIWPLLSFSTSVASTTAKRCCENVRISPVALRLGSKMDPYRRDLTNILHSYLILDSFGPVLGARAWSCKTTKQLPRLITAPEYFGNLRKEMSQVATWTFNVLYCFPFIWFNGSHYPRSYI